MTQNKGDKYYTNGYSIYKTKTNPVSISFDEETLKIKWDNNEQSQYHFLWLRDNCDCDECVTPLSKEQVFEICDVPLDIKPKSVELTSNNMINIVWDYKEHKSSFHPAWLKEHCYSKESRQNKIIKPKIWDKEIIKKELPLYNYKDIMDDDRILLDWLCNQRDYGFSKVVNVDCEVGTVKKLANRISFIRKTNFGEVFNVESKPNANSAAYTSLRLPLHTDLPTRELQPGLQFLHCLVNDADGGESILVDGFKIALYMKENFEEDFKALNTIPISFYNKDKDTDYRFVSPLISTDLDGNITEIRVANFLRGPLNVDGADVTRFYKAYSRFILLSRDEKFQYFERLNAGDLILFNNRRILHARNEFDLQSGKRHLQGCYLDTDELYSKIRVLQRAML